MVCREELAIAAALLMAGVIAQAIAIDDARVTIHPRV
jgi:hypothetical protein